jgi:hypothetical protein
MSDAICQKCQEPWDLYYLAHEGLLEYPGTAAPADLLEAHESLLDAFDAAHGAVDHYKLGGERLQKAVLRGEGCPSCWTDPKRAIASEDEQMEALAHNLFDSGWDGDPAELF